MNVNVQDTKLVIFKIMASSPTTRSLALMRKEGYVCAIVEHFNAWAGVRQDLYGFIDIVCLRGDKRGILGIQTTSTGNINARIKKIKDNPIYKLWLKCGNGIQVQGWSKKGAKGKVKHWTVKKVDITE